MVSWGCWLVERDIPSLGGRKEGAPYRLRQPLAACLRSLRGECALEIWVEGVDGGKVTMSADFICAEWCQL